MSTPKSPSALRLLWDGIAATLIGLLLRSLSDETAALFIVKIMRALAHEEQP